MKRIEEVRKALHRYYQISESEFDNELSGDAIDALSALEADMKELMEALRTTSLCLNTLTSDSFFDDAKRMARAALSKFMEAK